MDNTAHRAIAIVGAGAVLPDAPNVSAFWNNVKSGRYSVTEVQLDRWDPALFYDPDPHAPDKTYSKIGGWVREFTWEPMKWHLAIPPRVVDAMDGAQKWAIACTRDALQDYGYPERKLDFDRTAVILGNAMAGEKHYLTALRIFFPEYERELEATASFAALPENVRQKIADEFHDRMALHLPPITEDSMPGELSNCIAGRLANVFNFHGPNFVCDAACASAMAAISAAMEGLIARDFDAVITGGIDRNMGAPTFVKFCKIGALSATGTRPYAQGADGFVMGEGAALFLMKRLVDAEHDGDKIYAVLRGMGASSDGKGKGLTAPNPLGQKLAVERAWQNAGLAPATATLFEGHGTSTRVGDVVEVQSLIDVLNGTANLPSHSVALGSVKSNFGHLKGAAGAAGLLKAVLSLRDKVVPPSANFERANPDIDFAHSPLYVNTELKPWEMPKTSDGIRRAGLSAFGFGGTNFHAVLEEYIPGRLNGSGKHAVAVGEIATNDRSSGMSHPKEAKLQSVEPISSGKAPLRGALVIGGRSAAELAERLRPIKKESDAGSAPTLAVPAQTDLGAPERLAIDYSNAAELSLKSENAIKALAAEKAPIWKALRAQGIFRGSGPAPKVAFLYPGQGSQYVNMLKPLHDAEPIVADTFAEADRIMAPLLGKRLTDFIFVNSGDASAVANAEDALKQTAITQPAVLAADLALTRLLSSYGVKPDFAMGHSLGEYGALVAVGALPFADALEAVSARGREMTHVAVADQGRMAAVFAPLKEIERIIKEVKGYLVIANINSDHQAVVGGASGAVEEAMQLFQRAGYEVASLQVSHAFHTSIVAPASGALRKVLERLHLETPHLPIVANINGEFYPVGKNVVPQMLDILAQQVAAPVQFVKGLRTLYDAGARMFVEVGPKKALQGFAEDVLGGTGEIVSVFTNHPKTGDLVAFNQALCGLYAAGLGHGTEQRTTVVNVARPSVVDHDVPEPTSVPATAGRHSQLKQLAEEFLERAAHLGAPGSAKQESDDPVVITGAAMGLPGTGHVFDDENIARLLRGEQFIDSIPDPFRRAMVDRRITRLLKRADADPTFETIESENDTIKLAGRAHAFDLEEEFGIPAERIAAFDRTTALAIGAGIDALRDAGIPLVMRYKTTSKGSRLPDRYVLPESLQDSTGVIFASAFPGTDALAQIMSGYYEDHSRREQLEQLEELQAGLTHNGHGALAQEIERRIKETKAVIEQDPFLFDRRFLFRVLPMGHSQFAELIGARGPNTQINAACASTTQAVAVAEDWIRLGRCSRIVIVSADDITSDTLLPWFGSAFLASGVAATDASVVDAALPFDRRRHGMIIGMGAAALVVESTEAARERGIQPICEVIASVTANSAFHGSRLDVQHIGKVMEDLLRKAEARGVQRHEIAPRTVFVSHETYTPARGGSASAEIFALRKVFGEVADQVVIANTKGYTGHAMAAGIEDVLAVKALETGQIPPVANFKEIDPELGVLNLSKGGSYPVEYALRLGAGFGSQISMTLLKWARPTDGLRVAPNALGFRRRIKDEHQWNTWLNTSTGIENAELEVIHRTLRVHDQASATANATPHVAKSSIGPPLFSAVVAPLVLERSADSAPTEIPQPKTVGASRDSVRERVLQLVSEKTGYPADMLDVDLDLEADLGVDTVKQAEVFASIREEYGIPRRDDLKLREFPTLTHVIGFVYANRPDLIAIAAKLEKTVVNEAVKTKAIEAAKPALPTVSSSPNEAVREKILALVEEKTGYPLEMLDVDLDLEADLGVDTVKQAEIFATIRESYNIPRSESLRLRDFPTLKHVIQFVYDNRPDLTTAATPESQETRSQPPSPSFQEVTAPPADSVQQRVLALVVEKTGYPPEMLDMELDLEADLGVDTVKQAEMFAAIREIYGIPRQESIRLRDFPTLQHVVKFVYDMRPDLKPNAENLLGSDIRMSNPASSTNEISDEPTGDAIVEAILELVADKTGYPKDMLDLDLDLEADLGIDTVKQAEMMASIRAMYNIPRDENLKLRDFPTLQHVIQFARERPVPATPVLTEAKRAPVPTASAHRPRELASFTEANRVPRRVPVPVLRPPLSLCKSTGVVLGTGSRVVVMPDRAGTAIPLISKLRALDVEVLTFEDVPDVVTFEQTLSRWLSAGPVAGLYWLPALDAEGALDKMSAEEWHKALLLRVKLLYRAARIMFEGFAAPGAFLVSGVRLGGHHGYDADGCVAPLGGAVAGFVKSFKRERMGALAKVVDFQANESHDSIADKLIAETCFDPGAVEIGYKQGLRWTIALQEQSPIDGLPGLSLGPDTVFVVTGAAGSIVSAITSDLAAASSGTFYLLDVVPEPDSTHEDLKRFTENKEGLKLELAKRLSTSSKRATPAMVEKELARLERLHAAQMAIDAVAASGGTAHYRSVNLTDSVAVAAIMEEIRARHGRVDILLHAAGLERSHFLPEKPVEEFDLVFDVKADGIFNLLHAIGDMSLGAVVAFSSIAGRFGNAGQTDYSSANDLLCKIMSNFRATRPNTRGIAIDWTAWGKIGMATRGSIPKMMELAGIDMLDPSAGVPLIRRELTTGATRGELVVAQRLGMLLDEFDATGGLDLDALENSREELPAPGPMLGKITGMGIYSGLTMQTRLDPASQPFLHDHRIDGTPVLPGVMGIEAFAEAALCVHPGWHVDAIEEVRFLAPFKFYKDEPRTLTVEAVFRPENNHIVSDCRLVGHRALAGQTEPHSTTHFTARVRLRDLPPETGPSLAPKLSPDIIVDSAQIYRVYFHGPAYQVLERAWWDGTHLIGEMAAALPANHKPPELPTQMAPRLIELCFQTAGLWEMGSSSKLGLPSHVDHVTAWPSPKTVPGRLYAVVTPNAEQGTFDAEVVDAKGNRYLRLGGYRTTALPAPIDADTLTSLQNLVKPEAIEVH